MTLRRLLAEAKRSSPTYSEVGATRTGELPDGFRHDDDYAELGSGGAVFERAVDALRRWQPQIGAGLEVVPAGAVVEEGATVLLLIRVAVLWAIAPCRVLYVAEDETRYAFGYGTLPGHPERGEVAFAIERGASGAVSFRVTSFSRPADPLARLGASLTRRLQRRATQRYLEALAAASVGG